MPTIFLRSVGVFVLTAVIWSVGGFVYGFSSQSSRDRIGNLRATVGGTTDVIESVLEDVDNVKNTNLRSREERYRSLAERSESIVNDAVNRSRKLTSRVTSFVRGFLDRIQAGFQLVLGGFRGAKESPQREQFVGRRPEVHGGVIVFPSSGEQALDQKTLARLKDTFSDDVVIIPSESGETGVIKPIFRKKGESEDEYYLGDDYVYLLVPLSPDE